MNACRMHGSYEYQIGSLTAIHGVVPQTVIGFLLPAPVRIVTRLLRRTGAYVGKLALAPPDWLTIAQPMMRMAQKPQIVLSRWATQANRLDVIDLKQMS